MEVLSTEKNYNLMKISLLQLGNVTSSFNRQLLATFAATFAATLAKFYALKYLDFSVVSTSKIKWKYCPRKKIINL